MRELGRVHTGALRLAEIMEIKLWGRGGREWRETGLVGERFDMEREVRVRRGEPFGGHPLQEDCLDLIHCASDLKAFVHRSMYCDLRV